MFASHRLITGHLLFSSVAWSLLVHDANANGLRKSITPDYSLEECLICQLTTLDVQFENEEGQEFYRCLIDQDHNGVGDRAYAIALPSDFLDEQSDCSADGSCYISIPGGKLLEDDERSIFIPDNSTITVLEGSGSSLRSEIGITGWHETLVVRVTINGIPPEPSSTDLAGSVFGLGDNIAEQTMVGQYQACSFGQLEFYPAEGENIWNGVMDVGISNGQTNILSLLQDMQNAVDDIIPDGVNPRHLMFVVPYGTEFQGIKDWVAFGYVGGSSTFFNNWWGDYLTAQMHENGHNLGFHHSSEGSVEYGDKTGIMGYSYRQRSGPLMCFDGFKSYVLGWYSDKTAIVDPWNDGPWTGELAALVDYANDDSTTVLIKFGTAHVLFNRAKGMNAGTQEKQNQVTVTEGTDAGSPSFSLGGLTQGDSLNVNGAVIEVCEISISQGTVDYAKVSIFTDSSGC